MHICISVSEIYVCIARCIRREYMYMLTLDVSLLLIILERKNVESSCIYCVSTLNLVARCSCTVSLEQKREEIYTCIEIYPC